MTHSNDHLQFTIAPWMDRIKNSCLGKNKEKGMTELTVSATT
jgi:hypothetical protein